MQLDLNSLWTPLPTQTKFFEAISGCATNELRAVAYVGAVGCGKTWALCRAAIGLALAYPGMRILVGRHHSTDLRDTTKVTFFELIDELEDKIRGQYPPEVRAQVPPVGEFHKADNDYAFSNGSTILFRPLEEADRKYKSLNIAAVAIDEASEVKQEAVQMLMARRRQMGYPLVLFAVSNPTGYTHWLYKWFVKERTSNYHLFRTNTYENQANLPPQYIQEMTRKYSLDWVKRYVEGEWGGLTEGLPIYGGMFDPKIHVGQATYSKHRPVWVGVDFGYQAPAVVWAQPDRDNRCQIIREWLPHEIDTFKLCAGIQKRNGVWFPQARFEYFCGHDGAQHSPSAEKTGIQVMTEAGMTPSWRFHHVESGFTVIRNMLKIDKDRSNLLIDPSCEICIEAMMGEYKYKAEGKDGMASDKPKKNDIHDPVMDAFRYIAYQNYSLSGQSANQSARIRAFGKTVKDNDDAGDVEPVRKRTYSLAGWRVN